MSVRKDRRKYSQEIKSVIKPDFKYEKSSKKIPLQETNQNTKSSTGKKTIIMKKLKNSKSVIFPKKRPHIRSKNHRIITPFPEIKECPEEYEESSQKSHSTKKIVRTAHTEVSRFDYEIKKINTINQNNIKTSIPNENTINRTSEDKKEPSKERREKESRIRVVNYILKILNQNQIPELFFQSIYIFDKCLSKTKESDQDERKLLAGLSILLTAKYKQVPSEKLDDLFEDIAHGNLEKNYLINLEKNYLKMLGRDIMTQNTLEDYINSFLVELWINFNKYFIKSEFFEKLREASKYFAKIVSHYQNLDSNNLKYFAYYCIYTGFYILKKRSGEEISADLIYDFTKWLEKYKIEWDIKTKNINKAIEIILDQYDNYQNTDIIKAKNIDVHCPLRFL